jgi:hypothetical protein
MLEVGEEIGNVGFAVDDLRIALATYDFEGPANKVPFSLGILAILRVMQHICLEHDDAVPGAVVDEVVNVVGQVFGGITACRIVNSAFGDLFGLPNVVGKFTDGDLNLEFAHGFA